VLKIKKVDNFEKNSVLVVDDEAINLEVLSAILSLDYTVYKANNGSTAVEMAHNLLPDLILLDIVMPDGMNGYEVLAALKASKETRKIPVIFITGLDDVEIEAKGLALDVADFIHKPINTMIVQLRVLHQIQIVNQIRAMEQSTRNMQITLARMEAVVNNYNGIIWGVDYDGIITSFNGQYLKTIGVEPEALIGKNIDAAREKNKHVAIIANVEKTILEGPQDWENEIDGRIFHSHTIPVYDDGHILGVFGSSDDVTELVQVHTAIAATEEKSKFFARMSHEMRTPLNAVIGLSELTLETGGLSDEARENVEKISNAGSSLLYLVNDILDISKIEAGKFELVPVVYDIASMINDAVSQNIVRKGEKPINFILNVDENIPKSLMGDDIRIKQILNNLLSNAFKYTKKGTVEFNAGYSSDDAQIGENSTIWLIFSVRDTGIGISPDNINSLFTDYSQMDKNTNRKIEGTGLGLSIAKMMAEVMGGSISVESEYGKGSVFTLKLPQKFVTGEAIGPDVVKNLKKFQYRVRSRKPKLSRASLPYARVLVVDDVQTNLDVALGMMKPYRMQIDCAISGQQAVDAVRDEKNRYNAIFMDHMMPGMDGIEATRIIREEIGTEYAKTVPIIAFTANAMSGSEDMFLSKGFNGFLSKPIDVVRLDEAIQQWVRDEELEKTFADQQAMTNAGYNQRSGKERRTGYDRRHLTKKLDELDIHKGLERFDGNWETFVQILKSFAANTKLVLQTIKEVNKDNLPDYAIIVHGVKSSCRGICAEAAGGQAEALEHAAKAGDLDFVAAHNPALIETVSNLIAKLDEVFSGEEGLVRDRPKKDKPYAETLLRLRAGCEDYNIEEIETVMKEIEAFEYTSDDGLALWLRGNVDQMNYMEIVEKLSPIVDTL
jgi:PAS domain S-box-containing protein